jgi:pimeloyl-ACP methyl ester carboxylesterase
MEGTGHFAFIEKHAEFNQLVLDYLAHGTVAGAIE